MNLDGILSTLPSEIQQLPTIKGLVVLIQSLSEQLAITKEQLRMTQEQLQATQEQLTKAQEKIDFLEKELARFRKTPKKPKFRPNGMEPRNRTKNNGSSGSGSSMANSQLFQKETQEVLIKVTDVPDGARFKGYQEFKVQELSLIAKEIIYKLEVWQCENGEVLRAKIPEELGGGHFGPILKSVATNLYAQGLTQPALHDFLRGLGIDISTGQINNILLSEAAGFSSVSEEILKAGLEAASYIRTDDTGEKHQYKGAYCTHIGGKHFAYFKTTFSKSRGNFLKILLQGKEGYHINEAMIWHLFQIGVEDDILNLFEEHKGKTYRTPQGMRRLFNKIGLRGKKLYKQCLEAGLVGFITATILKPGQVLLSDRAGQFALFDHAGCWIHMERPLRKIVCTNEEIEEELKQVRERIWTLYRALKEAALTQIGREDVNRQYDALISIKTLSPEINGVIANFAAYRDEMLKALDHPGLPLHNNDSERDIRGVAKRRNLSGSTKSELGRKFRDSLLTIKQTCFRLGYSFWDYLQKWFKGASPDLSDLVRAKYYATST